MRSKRSRLLALCGMGLLLTLAALGYIRFYISRPVGSGPAGPVVARESFDKQFWRPFYDSSDPHYWFYDNVEDPNDRGYDAIRRIFINSIIAHSALNPTRTASD